MMVKEQSLSVLIKEADAVFSKYIRTKNSVGGFCMRHELVEIIETYKKKLKALT